MSGLQGTHITVLINNVCLLLLQHTTREYLYTPSTLLGMLLAEPSVAFYGDSYVKLKNRTCLLSTLVSGVVGLPHYDHHCAFQIQYCVRYSVPICMGGI